MRDQVEITIDKSADEVWKIVGDFGGLANWMPGVDKCDVEGDDRRLGMMGMEIVERQYRRDETNRVLVYGIVDGPIPVRKHEATISVETAGSGSRVTWAVEVEPDEMIAGMRDAYQKSLQSLKAVVEG